MKKIVFFISVVCVGQMLAQNSFNAIKTSRRGGIITTLVNPAELAGMPQKFDLNIIGFDLSIMNNSYNFTSGELGKTENLDDRLLNNASPNGLNVRVNADLLGPSLAIALNKKTSIGLLTRGRVNVAMNNIDVALAKSIIDGSVSSNITLPYTSPSVNNMNAMVMGWAELGLTGSTELYSDKKHALKIGGTVKALFSGVYANMYSSNLGFTIQQKSSGSGVNVTNTSGNLGVEYTGSSDPLNDISSNLVGSPSGMSFDAGISYMLKGKKEGDYNLKLGASLLDIGSIKYNLNQQNSRQFVINNGTYDPTSFQGNNLDDIINNLKAQGAVTEIGNDSSVNITLPMAFNFQADVKIWKPIYLTFNLNRRATDANDARNMQASNYLTMTPRISFRFVELYMPFTFAEIQGNSVGAGIKLGPLYAGSSSLVSALVADNNKAVDFHFGIRAGFGKRFK